MAEILVNGGVKIIPGKRPPVVETYHRLKGIERSLVLFRRAFKADIDQGRLQDFERVKRLSSVSGIILNRYSCVLEICANEVDKEPLAQESPDYYRLLKIFLSRASDSHTVLPFAKYVWDYLNRMECWVRGLKIKTWPFSGFSEYADFIKKRIDEALSVCRAYLCLLSSTMDSQSEKIDLARMIGEILATQRNVYIIKGFDRFEYGKADYGWLEKNFSSISLSSEGIPPVRNFEPLIYFICEHIITNGMKASFIAAAAQKTQRYNFKSSKYYSKIGEITEPKISVRLGNTPEGNVSAIFTDNGIGIPKEVLSTLFMPATGETLFRSFIQSNGSSIKLFPYIMDLTGITLHAQSEVGAGTEITLTIPKEAVFN